MVIAWGAKVDQEFRVKAAKVAADLGVSPSHLMACMAFESGETFSPSVRNAAGSGAVGLIQFMPNTAKNLKTSTEKLAAMTAVEQLDYVAEYFRPWRGRLRNLSDLYLAILLPKAVGKPDEYVLWAKGKAPIAYRQNAGLDANKDGAVTKAEATNKVAAKLNKGLQPGYVWRSEDA